MVDEKKSDDTIPLLDKDTNGESSIGDGPTSLNRQTRSKKSTNGNKKPSKKDEKSVKKVSLIRLFSFADKWDIILLLIGIVTAIIQGFIQPWLFYLMGRLGGTFAQEVFDRCMAVSASQCPKGIDSQTFTYDRFENLCKPDPGTSAVVNDEPDYFRTRVHNLIIQTMVLAFIQFVVTTTNYIVIGITSQRQTNRMRGILFRMMLNKNLSYMDKNISTEWYVKLSSNIDRIGMGIGDKLSAFISSLLIPIFGITICMCIYWELALVLFIWILIGVITISLMSKVMGRVTIQEMRAYGKAGSIAQQSLGALRTVLANNAIGYILQKYADHLDSVGEYTIKKGSIFGLTQSLIKLMQYFMNLIGLGSLLLIFFNLPEANQPTTNDILTILTVAALCPPFMIQAGAHSIYVSEAQGAAVDVFQMLDEDRSTNDNFKDNDKQLKKNASFERLEFDHVSFSYPARPEINALDDVTFSVERGNTVALVGHSGSGKSSCVQLLTRLYEVTGGNILLDGIPLTDYDREWLRQNIAIVSQETTLFSTSIFNNIKYGNEKANKEEVIEASKQANAHSFIMSLPNKYETMIGERGVNLSGGERQRIALARALVRQSPILLLDEPTSALDSRSEQLLQQAFDVACQGRITLIIAHRLSTIRGCSSIYVMDHGKVVEYGNHQDLMDRQGFYYNLTKVQQCENIGDTETDLSNNDTGNQGSRDFDPTLGETVDLTSSDINTKKSRVKYPFFALLKLARSEYIYIIVGSIVCLIYGGFDVIYASLNGYVAGVLQECNAEEQRHHAELICLICLIIGVVAFFINLFVHINFAIVAAAFVKRLRVRALAAFFRQEVGWHDQEVNSSAALCTRLSTDCDDVKRLVHMRIVFVFQTVSTIVFGSILGFLVIWELTLVVWLMIVIHGLTIAGIIYLTAKNSSIQSKIMQRAAMLSVECISNIRTVHQLGKNEDFARDYNTLIDKATMKKTTLFGLAVLVGIRRSIARFITGLLYIVAMKLVDRNLLRLDEMNEVFAFACYVSFMTTLIEMTVSEISRTGKASRNFVELFERHSLIDSESPNGIEPDSFDGKINYDKVSFYYPTRPRIRVLDQLTMEVNQGQRVALVGPSGCGKSSIIQLLARFYDVNKGRLLIDDTDIRSLNVHWWRSQLALVNQDPVLFDGTIKENLIFGCQYRGEDALPTMNQIIEAAKQAKIHDFISSLPQGYDTNVGSNGTQVSGGEKQRIVIARCLLRQAKLLLFDEATSAMDTVNEQLIQQALEQAHLNQHSTTIIVAHRLSTIRQCDLIFVLNNRGEIVESGTHESLVALRGVYYRMIRASTV